MELCCSRRSDMYTLKKIFVFRSRSQCDAFLEVASLYGDCTVTGNIVILKANLDFCMWRKLINLSSILLLEERPDIRTLSSQAGLRIFRRTGFF